MQQIDEHEVEVMELNQKFDDSVHKLDK